MKKKLFDVDEKKLFDVHKCVETAVAVEPKRFDDENKSYVNKSYEVAVADEKKCLFDDSICMVANDITEKKKKLEDEIKIVVDNASNSAEVFDKWLYVDDFIDDDYCASSNVLLNPSKSEKRIDYVELESCSLSAFNVKDAMCEMNINVVKDDGVSMGYNLKIKNKKKKKKKKG